MTSGKPGMRGPHGIGGGRKATGLGATAGGAHNDDLDDMLDGMGGGNSDQIDPLAAIN